MHHFTRAQVKEQNAALADVVLAALGHPPEEPHPLATTMGLRGAVEILGQRKLRDNDRPEHAFAAGIGSSDFSSLLAAGAAPATMASFSKTAEHRAFCSIVNVDNFLPQSVIALEDHTAPLEPLRELERMQASFLWAETSGPKTAALITFGHLIGISRQLIINGDLTAVLRRAKNVAATAARQEAIVLAETMEANPTMGDDAPMFDVPYLNLHATALDATALGEAMAMLRKQPTASGQPAGLAARYLVVHPDIEFLARSLVHDSGLEISVQALAGLAIGRWYLLADAEVSPTLGLLQLSGSSSPVRVEQLPYKFETDMLGLRVTADIGAAWLRRTGVVRGGA